MPTISRRLLANAVAARLAAVTNATGYYGQVGRLLNGNLGHEPQPNGPDDPRVAPYFILYPGMGAQGPDPDAGDSAVDLTQPFQVTAVAGDIEDLLALVDRIDSQLLRWTPDLGSAGDGIHVGYLRRPFGAGFVPALTDTQHSPARLYMSLQYQLTATT